MRRTACVLLVAGTALLAGASPAVAERPDMRLSGIGIELGPISPEDASTAFSVGGRIGLGTVWTSWLHLSSGVSYWTADRDDVPGEIQDLRVHGSLAVDLFDASGVKPYLITGPGLHWVGADVPNRPVVEDALDGFNVGWDLGGGLKSTRGSLALSAEFRGQFVNNVNGWGLFVGVGWKHRPNSF